jgi:hypothetical protein
MAHRRTKTDRSSIIISQKWEIEYDGIKFEATQEEIERAKTIMGSNTRELIDRYILDKRFLEVSSLI